MKFEKKKAEKPLHDSKKSHYLYSLYSKKEYETPLKRSLSGYEVEFQTLNKGGYVVKEVNSLIKKVKKDKLDVGVVGESFQHMLEVHAFPSKYIHKTSFKLVENVGEVIEAAESLDLILFPLGTYPGEFVTEMNKKSRYVHSARMLGEDKYNYYFSRCNGFHYHYTLPRGVFDKKRKQLKRMYRSRVKQTLIDSYNMLTAADPVLIALLQSSPFAEGRYYGKDTRVIFWRGKPFRFKGMFSKFPSLGTLGGYELTMTDLIGALKRKDSRIRSLMANAGISKEVIDKKSFLDYNWCPIKVNKLGTMEMRGPDMNYIGNIIGASILLNSVLRSIQQEFLHVMPSDIGINEPFKVEGNVVFIPPQSHVINTLQVKAAYEGFENPLVHEYCESFIKFACKKLDKKYSKLVAPIKGMVKKKASVSDMIIGQVRKKGYDTSVRIPNSVCAELSIKIFDKFKKDLEKTREKLEGI